ncbi:MAG: hypothetical protein WCF90_05570 [Methanomicrobiales archaeon]
MLWYDCTNQIDKDISRIFVDSESCEAFINESVTTPPAEKANVFLTREGTVREFLVSAARSDDDIVIRSAIDITKRKLAGA